MTLEEKLKGLLEGKLVLHTPTQEIFDKLMGKFINKDIALSPDKWKDYKESTCVDSEDSGKPAGYLSYGRINYYQRIYPQLPVVELTLDDFITPTLDKQQELLQKVLEVTKDISVISKLEDKYKTDVDFGTLVEIRDVYLEQLEDTF